MPFVPLTRIRNRLRNTWRRSAVGRMLSVLETSAPRKVRVVCATRRAENDFWRSSALGRSIAIWRKDQRLVFDIAFANSRGLPAVYNGAMDRAADNELLLFIHDDVWLDDPLWLDKLFLAAKRYDVCGLAGNRRRVKGQPTWLHTRVNDGTGEAVLDSANLSGSVAHGAKPDAAELYVFGPAPADCELLDGLFIAACALHLRRAHVRFDERFSFHYYDLDFCRSARARGLSVGTWPIAVVHQSPGAVGGPDWKEAKAAYLQKWGG